MKELSASPFLRLPSQNLNVCMENSHVPMDLAFWKSKCVTDTETAEMEKTKDLSVQLKEHPLRLRDVTETSSCVTTENASAIDLYAMVFGTAER